MDEQQIHEWADELRQRPWSYDLPRYASEGIKAASDLIKQLRADNERLRKKIGALRVNFKGVRKLEPPNVNSNEKA